MSNQKKGEFIFEAKKYKPFDLTKIDEKILSIKIDTVEDNDSFEQCDFSFIRNQPTTFQGPRFVSNSYDVSKISINLNDDDEYQQIDFKPYTSLLNPFQYKGVMVRGDQKYERVNQLTPAKEWPRITFLDDEKFKL